MLKVHLNSGKVTILRARRPKRLPGFALIRLIYGGICNTDIELQRGYYNFTGTPGHEFVGEVLESDTAKLVGKRVVGEINIGCGECESCWFGKGRHCATRSVLGILKYPGAFREIFTLPDKNLLVVPDGITDEQAVFTEPLAAACRVWEQVDIPEYREVALLGNGKLGHLIARALEARGVKATTFGRDDYKPLREYDFVVDATGSSEGLQQAIAMTRPNGILILKSTIHGLVPVDLAAVIVNELVLVGSRCGNFEDALDLLAKKKVLVDDLISDIMPLSEASKAFKRAAERGVLKVLLKA